MALFLGEGEEGKEGEDETGELVLGLAEASSSKASVWKCFWTGAFDGFQVNLSLDDNAQGKVELIQVEQQLCFRRVFSVSQLAVGGFSPVEAMREHMSLMKAAMAKEFDDLSQKCHYVALSGRRSEQITGVEFKALSEATTKPTADSSDALLFVISEAKRRGGHSKYYLLLDKCAFDASKKPSLAQFAQIQRLKDELEAAKRKAADMEKAAKGVFEDDIEAQLNFSFKLEPDTYGVSDIFRYKYVDVRRGSEWRIAQIKMLNWQRGFGSRVSHIRVHYIALSDFIDEWIDVSSETGRSRLRPLNTETKLPKSAYVVDDASDMNRLTLAPGARVDGMDELGNWYTAVVLERSRFAALIKFDGWSHVWNEWLPLDCYRIAPLSAKAKGGREEDAAVGAVDLLRLLALALKD